MIQFYLDGTLLKVNAGATITPTKDQTLESASIKLSINDIEEPFKPDQKLKAVFDDNSSMIFVIATDVVNIASVSQKLYTHTITATQNTRLTSKHLVRNTVFTQPTNIEKRGYLAQEILLSYKGQSFAKPTLQKAPYNWEEKIVISPREKVGRVWYRINMDSYIGGGTGKLAKYAGSSNPLKYITNNKEKNAFTFALISEDIIGYHIQVELKDKNIKPNEKIYDENLQKFLQKYGSANTYSIVLYDNMPFEFVVPLNPPYPANTHGLSEYHPFNMSIQIEIGVETYYYDAYDVLDILNKQYKQSSDNFEKEDLYKLPTSGELYDLLKGTIVPNMTFTQSTYYDAISEVFKLFDATFTIDENGYLGIEYLNKDDGKITDKKIIGKTSAISEDKYNNGLVSYYQNALIKEEYPVQISHKKSFVPARGVSLGVPGKQNAFAIITPHKIDTISRVSILVDRLFSVPQDYDPGVNPAFIDQDISMPNVLDLTPFVIENSIWGLLNPTDFFPLDYDYRKITQKGTITYIRGDNKINVSDIYNGTLGIVHFPLWNAIRSAAHRKLGIPLESESSTDDEKYAFPAEQDWSNVKIAVEYYAQIDGRVKIECATNKFGGEYLFNQGDAMVDIEKLGLNMLGQAFKVGEPTFSANQEVSTWKDVIKKGQAFKDSQGNKWIANVCSYTFFNDYILTNIQFVKNFNALSQSIKLNRVKRLSNISRGMAVKGEDNYCEYLYITADSSIIPNDLVKERMAMSKPNAVDFDFLFFSKIISATFGSSIDNNIDYARLITYNKFLGTRETEVYLPLVKYGAGNALCLEMVMDDPISAGYKTKIESGWFGENQYFTSVVPYTEKDGFFDNCDIVFETMTDKDIFTSDFPSLENTSSDYIGKIKGLKYYKKPNEIFALNYEIICLPFEKRKNIDFIGQRFINNNGLVKGKNMANFYLYCSDKEDVYDISSLKGVGTKYKLGIPRISQTETGFIIKMFHDEIPLTTKSWAICDENGNIYFASNSKPTDSLEQRLYFIPRHNRL